MNPLVSIVVPTFNGERYIYETMSHVFNQTYRNIEVIVVDDCSTDETVSFLRENFPSVNKLILSDSNIGLVKNINRGLAISQGEFVLFLGQDDLLPEDHIQKMVNEFSDSKAVLVHCNSILIDSLGNEMRLSRKDDTQEFLTLNPLKALSKSNFIQSCGLLIRRSSLVAIGGWDEQYKFYGEWLSYIRLAKLGVFKYCRESKSYYRKHPMSLIKKLNKDYKKDLCEYKQRCRLLALHSFDASFYQKIFLWFRIQFEAMKDKYR